MELSPGSSRKAAQECSPRRKLWWKAGDELAHKGAEEEFTHTIQSRRMVRKISMALAAAERSRHASPRQRLNRLQIRKRQLQAQTFQILLHMLGIRSSSERQHTHAASERKHNLCRSYLPTFSQTRDERMLQHFRIRRQQRESLIDNFAFVAEQPHFAIPP